MTPAPSREIELRPFTPAQLRALLGNEGDFEERFGIRVAPGVGDFIRSASAEYLARVSAATAPDPWRDGFAVFHRGENCIIGTCGFRSPPGADRMVEIGYAIVESHQGRGYGKAAAAALVDWASKHEDVRTIIAHTLPKESASTRILSRLGFRHIDDIVDPEDGPVWRWALELETGPDSSRDRRE